MLATETLPLLEKGNNLLAFSGGGDSTALFFLLIDAGIAFDIALVNYHTRPQSNEEARFAQELAERYGRRCFIHDVSLAEENFEHEARAARYAFFETLIRSEGYAILLTGHQLDDRLEWLLMQLCKGAGSIELSGMRSVETRPDYTLVRPLLASTRTALRDYLSRRNEPWFEDAGNEDPAHRRNRFRHRFAAPMMEAHEEGIRRSFACLDRDREALEPDGDVGACGALHWFKTPQTQPMYERAVDRVLKSLGYLMRGGERRRLSEEKSTVVGRRYAVARCGPFTLIAPYERTVMEKPFRETCRRLGIDPKLRPYLWRDREAFETLASLLKGAVDLHGE